MYDKDLHPGHPLNLMQAENEALAPLLNLLTEQCGENSEVDKSNIDMSTFDLSKVIAALQELNLLRSHYAKTEELFMPLLYSYGVIGPAQVLWDEDDEIKKELGLLTKAVTADQDNVLIYKGRIAALVKRIQSMITKEEKILFPQSQRFFTQEDWLRLYRDFPEMGMPLLNNPPQWPKGEAWAAAELAKVQQEDILAGKIKLPTGELTVKELNAVFSLLPVDLTFIDAEGKLRFFCNEGRVFPRPLAALGRDVAECHPPRIVPVVENLIAEFKAKKRTSLEVARYIMGKPVLVKYMAVYDETGEYMGTLEAVQNCEHILEKFARQ